MGYSYRAFLWGADQWFVAYAALPLLHLTHVQMFAVGHSVELYLKAAYAKQVGDVHAAKKKKHNMKALWDACKADPKFMPTINLSGTVYALPIKDLLSGLALSTLRGPDSKNYMEQRELYQTMRMLPDLKYLGTPLNAVNGEYAMATIVPHPYSAGTIPSAGLKADWRPLRAIGPT